MTTYFANFTANNGTRLISPLKDTNKSRIIKTIRDYAESERMAGNTCKWFVNTFVPNQICSICVASGGMTRNGKRYRDTL